MRSWILILALAACSDSDRPPGPVLSPPAVAPQAGFASDMVLLVGSEGVANSLSVLSLDATTGAVGLLPGSPADLGVVIADVESLAADVANRRIFFGSNLTGVLAVAQLDAAGRPVPVAGSPFFGERTGVSVIKPSPAGDVIYVGYHDAALISLYSVDAASGALTLLQSVPTGASVHVETMVISGGVLYAGFANSSNVVGFQLDAGGSVATGVGGEAVRVADVATAQRPDFLVELNGRLYCSLAQAAAIDAFTIEADGSLTRLAGAPYGFAGLGAFELIAVQPGGAFIAVGAEVPSSRVGLFAVNGDGSLTPSGTPLVIHDRVGGPEGLVFSADGRFLYLCDHVAPGLYMLEITGNSIAFAQTPRYALTGAPVDVLRLGLTVTPP